MIGCQEPVVTAPPIRPVYTYTVPAAEAEILRSFSGQLYAAQGTELAFEVGGRIVELVATQGSRYEKGDVLARIDNADFLTRQNDAEASFAQATQELRRVQRLYESDNASQSELDASVAKQISNRANFELAKKQTDNAVLKMPYAGVIADVEIDVQQVVTAGQTVFRVQGEGPMEFEFGVPSNVITQIEPDLEIALTIPDAGGASIPAIVLKVAPSSEQNTTFMITAILEASNSALRQGMDGEAMVTLESHTGPRLRVPLTCVIGAVGGQAYVWLISNGDSGTATVSRRTVEVGALLAEGHVEVLSGLRANEQILSRGVHTVEEGMRVRLQD